MAGTFYRRGNITKKFETVICTKSAVNLYKSSRNCTLMPEKWWNNPMIDTAFRSFCRTFGASAIWDEDGYKIDYDGDAADLPNLFEKSILTNEIFDATLRRVH